MPTTADANRPTDAPGMLRTLGALRLADERVTRPKPLLLLAYLALEGAADRSRLAGLFFGDSRDPRDALTTTLGRLGGLVAPSSRGDARITTHVTTDALDFQMQALVLEPAAALRHYRGPFVERVPSGVGPELEEWIVSTRERYACVARDLHLAAVRSELRRRRSLRAWVHAQDAVGLTETFALDPRNMAEVLRRLVSAGLPVPDGWWSVVAARPPEQRAGSRRSLTRTHGDRRRSRSSPGSRQRHRARHAPRIGGRS